MSQNKFAKFFKPILGPFQKSLTSSNPKSSLENQIYSIKDKINQGDLDEACSLFFGYKPIENSHDPEIIKIKARLHAHRNDYKAALDSYQYLRSQLPQDDEVLFGLGNVQRLLGQEEEAINTYQSALKSSPENPLLWLNLAEAYWAQSDETKALRSAKKAIELDALLAAPYCLVGHARHKSGDMELAEVSYRKALNLQPDYFRAFEGLVWTLLEDGREEEVLTELESNPAFLQQVGWYLFAGDIYARCCRYELAEKSYQAGLLASPDDEQLWRNLGICLRDTGKIQEALKAFDQAHSLDPQDVLVEWHRSLCLLLLLRFEEAWDGYENRRLTQDGSVRDVPIKEWQGEQLDDKHLLVHAEQGLGDEIMFACCIPKLLQMTRQITIECTSKLKLLFQRSFPECQIVAKVDGEGFSKNIDFKVIDYAVPIGSLPKFFLAHQSWLSEIPPYLAAADPKTQRWSSQLQQLGKNLKVGISWRGGVKQTRSKLRSIAIERFLEAFNGLEVDLISLQYGDVEEDLQQIESAGFKVHHWEEAIVDYDETAALASAVDLIVSVQTSIVHLAGAMGCKVWALIPYGAEWRYGSSNKKMVWYKDVTLFRQQTLGDWDNPLQRVTQELQALTAQN